MMGAVVRTVSRRIRVSSTRGSVSMETTSRKPLYQKASTNQVFYRSFIEIESSDSLNSLSPLRLNRCLLCSRRQFTYSSTLCVQQTKMISQNLPQPTSATKVLFDGDCDICRVEISALKWITQNKDDVKFVDISSPDYDPEQSGGVSYEDAMKEMHVVGEDGKVYTQGDAIRKMYRACGLGWMASVTEISPLKSVFDSLYMRFAEYRLRKALNKCTSGSCSIKLKNLNDKLKNG